jgi:hypothetical protein
VEQEAEEEAAHTLKNLLALLLIIKAEDRLLLRQPDVKYRVVVRQDLWRLCQKKGTFSNYIIKGKNKW